MKKITIDGNEACSLSSYYFTEVAGIYPITPSSPMSENIDNWSFLGHKNIFDQEVKVIEMQSEGGAAGMVHGSLQAGALTTTYTSSQGLLLMIPNMYKIAGEMLPAVFHVASRSLSTHALSIFGDHQDIYATRSSGFCILASSSVQDASYLSLIAHLSAIKGSLPFLHFFDGFRTSHEINKINVLEYKDFKSFIDYNALNKFRKRALNPLKPHTIGVAENDDIYFQHMESRNKYYDEMPDIVNYYMEKINKKAKTKYAPFTYYGSNKAKEIIVAMGSVCGTIKETIDYLNTKGYNVGLIEVHLYRPFSKKYFLKVLPKSVKKIAVLDRTKEPGSLGEPLYLDVLGTVSKIKVFGGRYGLSSKNTSPKHIKAVYDMLIKNPRHNFTIGINDDVTNLSLEIEDKFMIRKHDEIKIYGFGSDGMVSASKSIIKLIGDNTEKYVQGYFQYDSKKAGGVTVSHLRIGEIPIESTYYVENPRIVVLTKENYLDNYDILQDMANGGIFIVNTNKSKDEFINNLSLETRNILGLKKIKIYTIDAYLLADNLGLNGKISTIMTSVLMSFLDCIDYSLAKQKMVEMAKKYDKEPDLYNKNKKAINTACDYLNYIGLLEEILITDEIVIKESFLEQIYNRRGDLLPVSAFNPNGIFASSTTKDEKRMISNIAPEYQNNNCSTCSQCSIVCPHGVIRPFLLSNKEYETAPEYVKKKCRRPFEPHLKDNYYFTIAISAKDCTGCGICVKRCPGLNGKKALMFKGLPELLQEKEQNRFDYLLKNINDKKLILDSTVKGSQLKMPKFEFCGACAGCGETPYLKLLTQLSGENLIIANATGCSSIYGGSVPSFPYNVPWASSLFEDTAEYGYGMLVANNLIREKIHNVFKNNLKGINKELYIKWLEDSNDYNNTKEVYDNLDFSKLPEEIKTLKDYIVSRNIWVIGGDGWAYDIGYSGIDHILSTGDNINILVLDTEAYSNTGGQSSKATPIGSLAKFAVNGKKTYKKDLAKLALNYPNVYVAKTSLGYNPMQTIKCFKEAMEHNGPSIIIAYSPCIEHGIEGGLGNANSSAKEAVECGYFPTFRYNPKDDKFTLDSKNVDFSKYHDFLMRQARYNRLYQKNPKEAALLLEKNKKYAEESYCYYLELANTKVQ